MRVHIILYIISIFAYSYINCMEKPLAKERIYHLPQFKAALDPLKSDRSSLWSRIPQDIRSQIEPYIAANICEYSNFMQAIRYANRYRDDYDNQWYEYDKVKDKILNILTQSNNPLILCKKVLDKTKRTISLRYLLRKACETGNKQLVELLVRNNTSLKSADYELGEEPLFIATLNKHHEIARYLLTHGASSINKQVSHFSSLSCFALRSRTTHDDELFHYFLEHEALNTMKSDPRTAKEIISHLIFHSPYHAKLIIQKGVPVSTRTHLKCSYKQIKRWSSPVLNCKNFIIGLFAVYFIVMAIEIWNSAYKEQCPAEPYQWLI